MSTIVRRLFASAITLLTLAGPAFAATNAIQRSGEAAPAHAEMITLASTARTLADFDRGWRFSKGDFPNAAVPAFDDDSWRRLNLPHDWSIEGPLGKCPTNPAFSRPWDGRETNRCVNLF